MSFLDMMTNFLGAVIILFLLAAKEMGKRPFPNVKATATVVYNDVTKSIDGKLDATVLTNTTLQAGDTILVIVGKTTSEKPVVADQRPTQPQYTGPAGVQLNDNQVVVDRKEYEEALKNPKEAECAIIADVLKISPCNDKGTPANGDDDTYTVDVKVSAAGKCAASRLWKDNKLSGVTGYDKIKTYTFKVKDGPQTIAITDMGGDASKSITVNPPPSCVKKDAPTAVAGEHTAFPPPPGLNFQIEFDEQSGNVDLYVEKDGRWAYGGRPNDPQIGRWSDERGGWLSPGKSGVERVRQLEPLQPGTYKVYAHYKKGSPPSMKVSLFVSSQKARQAQKFDYLVSQSKDSPKNGGGLFMKTVTVNANGSFTIR